MSALPSYYYTFISITERSVECLDGGGYIFPSRSTHFPFFQVISYSNCSSFPISSVFLVLLPGPFPQLFYFFFFFLKYSYKMNILNTVAATAELIQSHTNCFSYFLWHSKPPQNPGTLLQAEAGGSASLVEGRQEMLRGLPLHISFMILWVRNSSRAHLCSRLCQLGLLGWCWRVPGGPAHASGVLGLAVS